MAPPPESSTTRPGEATGRVVVRGLSGELTHAAAEAADHLNAEHGDTVRLVAVGHGAAGDIVSAEIAAVDAAGIELGVQAPDGSVAPLRIPFAGARDELDDVDGLRNEFSGMVGAARRRVGDAVPVTSIEREQATTRELPTFVTEVSSVRRLTPGMLELTVAGGLETFAPVGPDQFLFLITQRPDGGPITPGFTMAEWMATEAGARPAAAYYTVRRWRPEAGELDLWVVLHGHDAGAAAWVAQASPGTPLALWGPRRAYEEPEGTTELLLVGDETALPAFSAILERRSADQSARVVIEVAGPDRTIDLPSGPDVATRWVYRGGEEPGTGTRLLDAVADLDLSPGGLYAYGAAEARQIAAVRDHLRHERNLPAARMRMVGYWRRT